MKIPRAPVQLVRFALAVGCLLACSAGAGAGLAGAEAQASAPPAAAHDPGGARAKPAAAAVAAVAAAGAGVPAGDLHGYALYPGDLIAIDVFDQPDLAVVVRIPPSGGIRFPLLGEIAPVVARDVNDLGDDIKRRLEADYLQQATLTITVREFAKRHAYVMGAIARPETLDLDPSLPTSPRWGRSARRAASSMRPTATRSWSCAMRPLRPDQLPGLRRHAASGMRPGDVELQPNDVVVVPHLDHIYVMGLVAHPGAVNLHLAHNTVLRAIGDAGGFLDEANRDAVVVVREGAAGAAGATIPLGTVGGGLKEIDLQSNDTIIVPRLDRAYIIGQVNHPGAVTLPSQDPLTVSKAISLAGGFDRYAREGNVQLLRSGVPVQTIDVAAILTGDTSKDDPPPGARRYGLRPLNDGTEVVRGLLHPGAAPGASERGAAAGQPAAATPPTRPENARYFRHALFIRCLAMGLAAILQLLVTRVILHMLGTTQLALWTLIYQIVIFLSMLDIGLGQGISRLIAEYEADSPARLERFWGTIKGISWMIGLIYAATLVACALVAPHLLTMSPAQALPSSPPRCSSTPAGGSSASAWPCRAGACMRPPT